MSASNRERRRARRDASSGGKGTVAVLCARVGRARRVPSGYGHSVCSLCGHPVWLSPRIDELARELGMTVSPLCCVCMEGKLSELVPSAP